MKSSQLINNLLEYTKITKVTGGYETASGGKIIGSGVSIKKSNLRIGQTGISSKGKYKSKQIANYSSLGMSWSKKPPAT